MAKSMTAFGRSRQQIGGRPFIIEIHSVNRKGLEVGLHVPKELLFAEMAIRRRVTQAAKRGHVVVKIIPDEVVKQRITFDACKKMHEKLSEIARTLDPSYKVTFDTVLEMTSKGDFLFTESESAIETDLENALDVALGEWDRMKGQEGKVLTADILGRLKLMKTSLKRIEKMKEGATAKYREKLLEKLAEVKQVLDEDRDRVLREVVLYVEKLDITEEIVRLESHIAQVQNALSKTEDVSIGRTIDFLIQEMLREANTISSKASDLEVIQEDLLIKSEIEKIREQVQNLE